MALDLNVIGERVYRRPGQGILSRTGTMAAMNQDYTVCFKIRTALAADPNASYPTFFMLFDGDDDYSAGIWAGFMPGSNEITVYSFIDTTDWQGVEPASLPLMQGQEHHFAYTRSGTTHTAYLDGVNIGTWTHNVSGSPALNTMRLGSDTALAWYQGDYTIRQLREWQGTALTSGQLNAERASDAAVLTTNLFTDLPLSSAFDLTDTTNNNHDLVITRAVKSDWVNMAVRFHSSPLPVFTGPYTAMLWFKPIANPTPEFQAIYGVEGASWYIALARGGDWKPYAAFQTPGAAATGQQTDPNVAPLNVWQHVTMVRTGTSILFYINGLLIGTQTADFASVETYIEFLGHIAGQSQVRLAYFRSWSAALSQPEIALEMPSRLPLRYTDLLANTPLETHLLDSTDNQNHWTGEGAVSFSTDSPLSLSLVLLTGSLWHPSTGTKLTTGQLRIRPRTWANNNTELVAPVIMVYAIPGDGDIELSLAPSQSYVVEFDPTPLDLVTPLAQKSGYFINIWTVPATGPVDISTLLGSYNACS
jgi:hypothetical protein